MSFAPPLTRTRSWIMLFVALGAVSCSENSSRTASTDVASPRVLTATERVVVHCAGDCAQAISSVRALRGSVSRRFRNVAGFTAELPVGQLLPLSKLPGIVEAAKDVTQASPKPALRFDIHAAQISTRQALTQATYAQVLSSAPKSYSFDAVLTGAAQAHRDGIVGTDIVVAVIDSGVANNSDVVPALSGSIVGGETFIDDPAEPSATSTLNDDHGTWAATMIAGHGAISLSADSDLAQAISTYQPDSILAQPDGKFLVPMVGSAPETKIYSLKIFSADQSGAPRSRTLAALDRVLTLKRNFNQGLPATSVSGDGTEENPFVYDALNIQVVNVSLGGPTLYAGGSMEDELISAMLSEGIVVVAAAGNEGFAAMTVGSPAAAIPAISVGAANVASNERVLRELQVGPGGGSAFRPTDHIQIADFSSRGPTADGRNDPDLVANGFAVFVQGAAGDLALVSGTSFSAPTVAGAAALLFQAAPRASAAAVRAALIESANAAMIGGSPSVNDQGRGFLDIPAALELLGSPSFAPRTPTLPPAPRRPQEVADAIERLGIHPLELDDDDANFTTSLRLAPGEVAQFFVDVPRDAKSLTVELTEVEAELAPEQQNSLFGDDIALVVVDAPLSFNETRVHEFLAQDSRFVIEPLQTGLARVALQGDWTNAGMVSANVSLSLETQRLRRASFQGRLSDAATDSLTFQIGENTTTLNVELAWRGTWAVNPAHDIDIVAIDPDGEVILDGATLASPERISVADPLAGPWTLLVDGFMLHGFDDNYVVRITDQNDRLLVTDD